MSGTDERDLWHKLAEMRQQYEELLRDRDTTPPGSPGYHSIIQRVGTLDWRIRRLEHELEERHRR